MAMSRHERAAIYAMIDVRIKTEKQQQRKMKRR